MPLIAAVDPLRALGGITHRRRCGAVRTPCQQSQSRDAHLAVQCHFRAVRVSAVHSAAPVGFNGSTGSTGSSIAQAYAATATLPPVVAAAAQPPAISTPEPIPGIHPPKKAYEIIVALGAAKAVMAPLKVLFMGVMAGVYIGLGGLLALTVGANCPGLAATNPGLHKMVCGSFGLPVGLVLVLTCGAELFTGNVAMLAAAVVEGKATLRQWMKSCCLSFVGNVIGTLGLVGLVCATGVMATSSAPAAAAVAKTSLTFSQAFSRGILCNLCVCLAVWMASASTSFPGKMLAAWLAVSTFTAIGFEHSIANGFIIPMGIAVGAPVSFLKFTTANLLPVTLGNIVGGLALALAYGYAYGALGKDGAGAAATSK